MGSPSQELLVLPSPRRHTRARQQDEGAQDDEPVGKATVESWNIGEPQGDDSLHFLEGSRL